MSKTILLAGATGLVGSACLPVLLADERTGKVIALVRRPLPISDAKLEQWVGDDLQEELKLVKVDAVICCLGTTIKNAGSQAAFLAVDKALPLGIARWAKAQGVPTYVIISAIGADTGSRVFYSRVKGEVEQELEAMQFSSLSIFQPSVLSGPRKEKRFGERVGIVAMKLLGPLLLGPLARLRVMPHSVLARALVEASINPQGGVHRYTYREIRRLSES